MLALDNRVEPAIIGVVGLRVRSSTRSQHSLILIFENVLPFKSGGNQCYDGR
jgi:hypothetical protein